MTRVYFIILLALSFSVDAKEHEVIGKVFTIEETSMLEFIQQRLADKQKSGELEKMKKEFISRATNTFKNPHGVSLKRAYKDRVRYFDPTITLSKDIKINGKVLYHAGTSINPLDIRSFSRKLIFIDGSDEAQKEYAIKIFKESGSQYKIILVSGSPFEFMKENKIRVFFDQTVGENGRARNTLVQQFQIENLPTIVYQEEKIKYLTIKEVALHDK